MKRKNDNQKNKFKIQEQILLASEDSENSLAYDQIRVLMLKLELYIGLIISRI